MDISATSSFDLYKKSIWTILGAMENSMQVAEKIREPAQVNAVALKAYARVADEIGRAHV